MRAFEKKKKINEPRTKSFTYTYASHHDLTDAIYSRENMENGKEKTEADGI